MLVTFAATFVVRATAAPEATGDWDVNAQVDHLIAASTSITQLNASISLTSATLSGQAGGAGLGTDATATATFSAMVPTANITQGIMMIRLSIAATTTVFLVAQDTFSLSTVSAFGTIRARRVR